MNYYFRFTDIFKYELFYKKKAHMWQRARTGPFSLVCRAAVFVLGEAHARAQFGPFINVPTGVVPGHARLQVWRAVMFWTGPARSATHQSSWFIQDTRNCSLSHERFRPPFLLTIRGRGLGPLRSLPVGFLLLDVSLVFISSDTSRFSLLRFFLLFPFMFSFHIWSLIFDLLCIILFSFSCFYALCFLSFLFSHFCFLFYCVLIFFIFGNTRFFWNPWTFSKDRWFFVNLWTFFKSTILVHIIFNSTKFYFIFGSLLFMIQF